jgi:hypothetical protein
VKIPVYSADTSLKATGQIVTTDTEDTTRSTFSTNVHMRLRWFPPPFALFQVQDISMDTIHTSFSRRRSVVTETTSDFPVSIEPTFGAGGHGAAIGGFVDIDNWSVGGLAIPEEKPLWLLKHRIIIFKGI